MTQLESLGATKVEEHPHVTMWQKDHTAILVLDDPNAKVNTLNSRLFPEFDEVFKKIETDKEIKSVVLISGKKGCFVAGADIDELRSAQSEQAVKELSQNGQKFFDRIDRLKKTVIAAIDGACLGGGLELALACDYRIASTSKKTVLGLPEVMLGLLPGAGGTQRLPRLIGLEKAMSIMLTGANVRPAKALKLGLVDYLTTSDGLAEVAIDAAERIVKRQLKLRKKEKKKGVTDYLESVSLGRQFMFSQALKQVESKTRGLYPAPKAIIDVLSYGLNQGMRLGLKKEAEEFAKLSQTPQSRGLISLYFGQNELKKNRYGKPDHSAKDIAVVGAGLMGAGISLVSIQKGFRVRMKDVSAESLGKGKKYVWDALNQRVRRKAMSSFEQKQLMSRMTTQLDYHMISKCDVVIEAVFEDMDLKHRVLKELEGVMHEDAVFASNTSALPIKEIAKASSRPHNVLGMHYFSPVHKMPLLEIIVTDETSDIAASMAVDTGLKQGKTVIVVKDGPGFYTTRILAPFMDEAAQVMAEGVGFHRLDSTMKDFGFPVGPVALMDEVGLDVAFHVGHDLGAAFGDRMSSQDPAVLKTMMDKGDLGRKSGKGFYVYGKKPTSMIDKVVSMGKKQGKEINPEVVALINKHSSGKPVKVSSTSDIQKRLGYRMINEAALCLQEGILSRPIDGDIGAVFGLGFPPFWGGPFRYVDANGVQKVVDDLNRFADQYGKRFEPAQILQDMAKEGKKFYSTPTAIQ